MALKDTVREAGRVISPAVSSHKGPEAMGDAIKAAATAYDRKLPNDPCPEPFWDIGTGFITKEGKDWGKRHPDEVARAFGRRR